MRIFSLTLIIVLLAACSKAATPPPPAEVPTESPRRALLIAADPVLNLGQQVYNLRCAHCHGYNGEGQLENTIENTLNLGMMTIPPHDETGHTWQHPDQLLIRVIREGIANPLDQFPMEPYASVMTDEEIHAVIAYMRLWWTDEQRAHQQRVTEHWAELDQQLGAGGS